MIVPLTILMALHPAPLWFEHTLLAESPYLFCVVALALAGTVFARWPTWETFGFLLAALFFTAGARPEGRLFLAFGVLLTLLVYRRGLRREVAKIVTLVVFCVVTLIATRTAQAGILYTRRFCTSRPTNPASRPTSCRVCGPCGTASERRAR